MIHQAAPRPVTDCQASIRGHCLAAAAGQDVCAIQDGECVYGPPDPAPARHDSGPSVRECAEADARWWGGEKTGE
ncbi:hypothetical protein F7R91_14535 [Streptomyces luteolifulvus]|uniref:Uncharacterized protein n=1 Tax=Streptomyces luteolifulvus TaxID=2615112 RepID=A0A6H9UZG5_9ACTN|nr:hypothetical protein [Streptomyces luteolifulvus]KAB1146794.1 hypothetical protein F7R91_14535 [Streptomyces luteolifulvus]